MQRKFITNLLLLIFLNLLVKPFWILGIDRSVQNAVGSEEYGMYYALFNFSLLLNILLDIGITNYNNRNIARHNQLVAKHLSGIAVLKLLLGFLYLFITIFGGWILGYHFDQILLLILLAFNQFLVSFILYLRSNLSGLHFFRWDSIISVLDRTIMIIVCAALLWTNITDEPFRIQWFVYAQTGSYLVTAAIAFSLLLLKTGKFNPKLNIPFFMVILKQSFPFAALILMMTFYNRIDSVMIERLLPDGDTHAGIYAQGYRLLDATNMIAFLFAGLLLPIFSKMLRQKERVEELVNLSSRLLIAPAAMIAVGSYFFREEIMDWLYMEYTDYSSPVFGLLMFCFIPVSSSYIFGTLLTANGNLKALNIMAASGMVFNIVLNLILIPKLHSLGAAFASLLTQIITATIQIIIVQYIFRFKVNYRLFMITVAFVSGIVFIAWMSRWVPAEWKIQFVLMSAAFIIWTFLVRMIDLKSIYRIFRYGEINNS